jgi:hypothetical protein
MRITKTPMQMRREAEQRGMPKSRPLTPCDPSKRPLLGRHAEPDPAATAEWLAHIVAGRIPCPEPVEWEVK